MRRDGNEYKEKLKVLKELCIPLSTEDKRRLKTCKNRVQLDNTARKLIMRGE